jgi:hypothetical protein
MSDLELIDAVAHVTGETQHEIRRRGFVLTCPLKYKFRYIDGLPVESVSSALVFGSGIHTAVEQHYQSILSGEEQPDLEALLFAYRSAWLPHDPDAIQ